MLEQVPLNDRSTPIVERAQSGAEGNRGFQGSGDGSADDDLCSARSGRGSRSRNANLVRLHRPGQLNPRTNDQGVRRKLAPQVARLMRRRDHTITTGIARKRRET